MTESRCGSNQLLPHLEDGNQGGLGQGILRILVILLRDRQKIVLIVKGIK